MGFTGTAVFASTATFTLNGKKEQIEINPSMIRYNNIIYPRNLIPQTWSGRKRDDYWTIKLQEGEKRLCDIINDFKKSSTSDTTQPQENDK